MNIKITKKQRDLINKEIIDLENSKSRLFSKEGLKGWEIMHIAERINYFKEIIEIGYIEL